MSYEYDKGRRCDRCGTDFEDDILTGTMNGELKDYCVECAKILGIDVCGICQEWKLDKGFDMYHGCPDCIKVEEYHEND